ncbi:MAG: molybdopterin-dependent oxidoreductase [Firmicutes bacterium]|nr:molybdopterin-dependent oxidoreductase [Bacillota bacterium]
MELRRTVCPHDCPDACGILAQVDAEQNRVIRVSGAVDHPFTRGMLCGKVAHYEARIHAPGRLLTPLRRSGPKGSGQFEPCSWEEALELIVRQLQATLHDYGGQAVLPYWYAGTMGLLQEQAGMPFFRAIGACELDRTICSAAADAGWEAAAGGASGSDPEGVVDSDCILLWGSDAASTNMHFFSLARQAQRRGAQVIVIDPWQSKTAKGADWWIHPCPGTDGALALGLMHLIVAHHREETAFLDRFTEGFEQLRQEVLPQWTVERVARICGIAEGEIKALARRLEQARAPFLRIGVGISRHPNGAMTVRTLVSLAAVLGAFEKLPGGGCLLFTGGAPLRRAVIERPDLRQPGRRVVNMSRLGEALTELEALPIKFLFVYSSNPANVAPMQGKVRWGLAREDLFTVVHEQFLTDTARYADLVLPATTMAEHADVYRSYGHYYLQLSHAIIAPQGESWSNWRLFSTLARRMGLTDPLFLRSEEELLSELVKRQSDGFPEGLSDESWAKLWRGEPVRVGVVPGSNPLADSKTGAPRHKIRFYSQKWQQIAGAGALNWVSYRPAGLPELSNPSFNETNEETNETMTLPQGWLRLVTAPGHLFLNTSFQPVEALRQKERGPQLLIHPNDAQRCGCTDGIMVYAENAFGRVRFRLVVTSDVPEGVAVAPGIWDDVAHGRSPGVNALVSERVSDFGGGPTFYASAIRVLPLMSDNKYSVK